MVSAIVVAAFLFAMRPSFRFGRVHEVLPRSGPYDASVRVLRRIAVGVAAALAVIAYVWTAAVRAAPGVRQRKAEARARRRVGA
jgi:hypothetical protein